MNVAEYTGPVVNVELPCAHPVGFWTICPVCAPRPVWTDDIPASEPVRIVEIKTVAVWVYRDMPQNVSVLAGQCGTCGTVLQTWHCTQQEATHDGNGNG